MYLICPSKHGSANCNVTSFVKMAADRVTKSHCYLLMNLIRWNCLQFHCTISYHVTFLTLFFFTTSVVSKREKLNVIQSKVLNPPGLRPSHNCSSIFPRGARRREADRRRSLLHTEARSRRFHLIQPKRRHGRDN